MWRLMVPLKREIRVICFFFQAEDGIRDLTVTGVQTCALPISAGDRARARHCRRHAISGAKAAGRTAVRELRSEERRVGKSVDLGGRRIIKKKKKKKRMPENEYTRHKYVALMKYVH